MIKIKIIKHKHSKGYAVDIYFSNKSKPEEDDWRMFGLIDVDEVEILCDKED